MAAAATGIVTLDQYLSMSFEHDMEFVDGGLKERPMPTRDHARVQALLCMWFGQFEGQFGFECLTEIRTRVSANRVRLPDFALVAVEPNPSRVLTSGPLLAIEILSDDDKQKDLRARARDLADMGAGAVWLLDPDEQMLSIWSGEAWLPSHEAMPMTPTGAPLDLAWLWRKAGLLEAGASAADTAP